MSKSLTNDGMSILSRKAAPKAEPEAPSVPEEAATQVAQTENVEAPTEETRKGLFGRKKGKTTDKDVTEDSTEAENTSTLDDSETSPEVEQNDETTAGSRAGDSDSEET